ncbi:hypothetical protein [Leptospira licerasiae]|uniref:hypothetical protein n=1 Tax=Leptospira licerasiae TaxID=447106 RepID=UPI0010838A72|nr:hypothetical protein [Leptospira licerasiae]TGM87928.1 hypothetical protein EHR05_14855 [Leptospira licerasiae]
MKKPKKKVISKIYKPWTGEAKRLLSVVKDIGMREVVGKTGITEHTFQRWAREDEQIKELYLNELMLLFGISKKYIRTGRGDWKATAEERLVRYNELIQISLSTPKDADDLQTRRLMDMVQRLDSEDKELILGMFHKLLQEKKNKTFRSLITLILTLPQRIFESAHKLMNRLAKDNYSKTNKRFET